MSWTQLKLGSIDLTSGYTVLRAGDGGLNQANQSTIVPLRASDGARLGYHRRGQQTRPLHIEIAGDDYEDSVAKETALIAALIQAENYPRTGTLVTYIEQEASEAAAQTWKVLKGEWQRTYELMIAGQIAGMLTLELSKV